MKGMKREIFPFERIRTNIVNMAHQNNSVPSSWMRHM